MAAEIENVDGSADPDHADGEFRQPDPDWAMRAAIEMTARSPEEQLAFVLHTKFWCRDHGNLQAVQAADVLIKDLVCELAREFVVKDVASGALKDPRTRR